VSGSRTRYLIGLLLTVFATQEQFAACPTAAMFLQVPAFESLVVQAVPPLQIVPPGRLTHGPAETNPTRCRKPGKPVSFAQV